MTLEAMDRRTGLSQDALAEAGRRAVLKRLDAAGRQVRDGTREALAQALATLREAQDQLEAWQLAQVSDPPRHGGVGPPHSRLAFAALRHSTPEPLNEFRLIPLGVIEVERPVSGGDFVFTRKHAESAVAWFERIGRKLAIDYEHQSFERFNTRSDGLRPAAGWIGGLEVREDGLWATGVTWTPRAAELLRSGEYRYFSPVIYWTDDEHSDVAALGPVALTNDPAMRGVAPLAASRARGESPAAEGAAEDARDADRLERSDAEGADVLARLAAAEEEVELLRRKLELQEADTFIERGLRLGKVVDSTAMDWRDDYLRDRAAAELRLERAPVLLPPGRVLKLDAQGRVRSGRGVRRELEAGAGVLRRWGIEAADLEAFDRAQAEGRVRATSGGNG